MATPAYKQRFTYEDYLLFPDDGRRHELIGGEHYVSPSPVKKHQRASSHLQRHLGPFIHDNGLGFLYTAPFDVILSDEDVVQPDLIFETSADTMWEVAIRRLGAEPSMLHGSSGVH